MSDVLEILKRGDSGLEALLRAVLLDSDNKVPADRLRIVGAVADGAIIEQGSNANGDWVRLTNGLQICESTIVLNDINIAPNEMIWRASYYTPPANFSGGYKCYITNVTSTNNDTEGTEHSVVLPAFSGDGAILYNTGGSFYREQPGEAVRQGGTCSIKSATINIIAIGKWK